jgi:hypothetical protein
MTDYNRFELRRQSDDLVYRFQRKIDAEGRVGYQRVDRDLWIVLSSEWGWIAIDPETGAISGRSWETHPSQQRDHPPEGIWVSRKGGKSYVYDLVYL